LYRGMRAQLEALTEELRRRRAEGMTRVAVSEATLARVRAAAGRLKAQAGPVAGPVVAAETQESRYSEAEVPEMAAPEPAKAAVRRAPVPMGAPIPEPPVVELPAGTPAEQMDWLRAHVLASPVCNAHVRPGRKVVFGVGAVDAQIFFCGEGPGADEEIQGEPVVGPAGQLLTRIIQAMGLTRAQVYIGNVMKWRPEMPTEWGNREPTPEETAFCLPYLRAQLAIVRPRVIVALGKTAVNGLLGYDPSRKMTAIRGRWREFAGVPLMPTFHPSYLLRNNSMTTKRQVWEDMMLVMERAGMTVSEKQRGFFVGGG
jgi:uracil-DNA glycosylase family 4